MSSLIWVVTATPQTLTRVCIVLVVCSYCAAETLQYRTFVAPQEHETLRDRCVYQMTLPHAERRIQTTLVIFERGWQVGNLYFDPDVLRFAARHDLALLLATHCRSKENEDIDVIPEHGIGRALVTALEQFAQQSKHLELARGKLILFGFSGAGSLVARMASYLPERIIAVVAYAPGQYDPLGMDTIQVSEEALVLPQLIIANGADDHAGTARPYAYYADYRRRGAPLTFVLQSRTPHCCVMNVLPLALAWLDDVLRLRRPTEDRRMLTDVDQKSRWLGIISVEDGGKKAWDTKTWNVASAQIVRAADYKQTGREIKISRAAKDEDVPASGTLVPTWLPSRKFASLWLAFEQQPTHPITPLQ